MSNVFVAFRSVSPRWVIHDSFFSSLFLHRSTGCEGRRPEANNTFFFLNSRNIRTAYWRCSICGAHYRTLSIMLTLKWVSRALCCCHSLYTMVSPIGFSCHLVMVYVISLILKGVVQIAYVARKLIWYIWSNTSWTLLHGDSNKSMRPPMTVNLSSSKTNMVSVCRFLLYTGRYSDYWLICEIP